MQVPKAVALGLGGGGAANGNRVAGPGSPGHEQLEVPSPSRPLGMCSGAKRGPLWGHSVEEASIAELCVLEQVRVGPNLEAT